MADTIDPSAILAMPPRRRGIALKSVKFRDAVRLFEATGRAAFSAVSGCLVRVAVQAAQASAKGQR